MTEARLPRPADFPLARYGEAGLSVKVLLDDKLALVTASTGGIGKEVATALAREVARVIINGRTAASVESAIADVRARVPGAKLEALASDQPLMPGSTRTEGVAKLVQEVFPPDASGEGGDFRELAQPLRVASGRRPEQSAVLASELRGALVAHAEARGRHVDVLAEQEPAGLLEPQLLLVLQRTHGGDGLEVVVQRGRAHVDLARQVLDAQRLREARLEPANGPGAAPGPAVGPTRRACGAGRPAHGPAGGARGGAPRGGGGSAHCRKLDVTRLEESVAPLPP